MDGYTKAAIKESLAECSPRQVKSDAFMERIVNGTTIYAIAILFYGFWGWVIWESLIGS